MSISSASAHIERVSVYRKSALADLYRRVPALWQVRYGLPLFYFANLKAASPSRRHTVDVVPIVAGGVGWFSF